VLGPDLQDPTAAETVEAPGAAEGLEDDPLLRLDEAFRVREPPPVGAGLDVGAPDAGAEGAGLRVQIASISLAPLAFRT
jgi:hypothetical protein